MMAEVNIFLVWAFWLAISVVSITIDALFSGMETGIYVLNKIRMDLRAETGSASACFLRKMLVNSNNLLAVLLIGTNIFRYITTFAITTMFFMAGAADRAEWLTLAVATPLLFVLCDSVPKGVFHIMAENLTYRFAWFLKIANLTFLVTGFSPLVRAVSAVLIFMTGAKKRSSAALGHHAAEAVLAEGHASGVLSQFQSIMADRVMGISLVQLQDVMVPMENVATVKSNFTRQQLMELVGKHKNTRMPVLAESGAVEGTVDIYRVLLAEEAVNLSDKMNPALMLSSTMAVADALYKMQRANSIMAIVAEPGGRHIGIVTIKDLVEEIVGELEAW